ncbi:MAG: hypothetical protein PVJ57_07040 [Phycisphaerae bacterium]|jgi:hypothetical protein
MTARTLRLGRLAGTIVLLALIAVPLAAQDLQPALVVRPGLAQTTLALDGALPFHATTNEVAHAQLVAIPDSPGVAAVWDELGTNGESTHFCAISLDGQTFSRVREATYDLKLHCARFDPAVGAAVVPPYLQARPESELYYVQFVTQPLDGYRQALRDLGVDILIFQPDHAYVVRMAAGVRDAVAGLPFVRWVGPVQPAYKLEGVILDQLATGEQVEPRRYSIMLYERGTAAQDRVCSVIDGLGGTVHGTTPAGFRIEATLSLEQVLALAGLDDVMFIDRKGQLEVDMDIVRQTGGANYIENTLGFTGQGVRGEVADTELDLDHQEWSQPPLIHIAGDVYPPHGSSCYGVLFAQGVVPQARGLLPDGTGIYSQSSSLLGGGTTRYTRTAELVDPAGPYRAVFQTNSTGDSRTYYYTTISAEMDDILFLYDILICQSQSNAGNQDSRPQAWAKNIVSGGAFKHYNTLDRSDDHWDYSGSIGPADDGRIKPDLSFFYDDTYTTATGNDYTEFGGTSGATPSIAGHFGLFFQMWHEGVFPGFGGGLSVFDDRPHMTTAKAVMINTAYRYNWLAGGPNGDIDRYKQGWGVPNLEELYDIRDLMLIVDETDVLTELGSTQYSINVAPDEPNFRATLVYADPRGNPSAGEHRINDLSLRVYSPSGTIYWGNNGLTSGNVSTADGVSNTLDTVENVFIPNPENGEWIVEVIADEINEDSHVETGQVDADYALVVTGGTAEPPPFTLRLISGPSGLVSPGTLPTVTADIIPGTETIVPGSETLYYRYGPGEFHAIPLTYVEGDRYTADLPRVNCLHNPEYYVQAEGSLGTVRTLPPGAPDSTFSFDIGVIGAFYSEMLDSNPGWTTQGLWAFGTPTGGGGQYGGPDPTSGYTGSYVYGYNLSGDYENNLSERHLTSTAIDCAGRESTTLSFWRWLGVETPTWDHAYFRVSTNGSSWTTLWENGGQVADTAWTQMTFDIADIADDEPTLYLRWTMGTTDTSWQFCGWNVDDIELTAFQCNSVFVPGDLNCDGTVDNFDIRAFVVALTATPPDYPEYYALYPDCDHMLGDVNNDGAVDNFDISPFVDLLSNP